MKSLSLITFLLSLGVEVIHGFPSNTANNVSPKLRRDIQDLIKRSSEKRLLFNSLTTPIDGKIKTYASWSTSLTTCTVSGSHKFIPPNFQAGDQRGPCPGLNALANHGYIGRNGVTNVGTSRS